MFNEIYSRMNALTPAIRVRAYDKIRPEVIAIVDVARRRLTHLQGRLGPWEAQLLGSATVAIRDDYLNLALHSVHKAIVVSRLQPDDYDNAFYCRRRVFRRVPH